MNVVLPVEYCPRRRTEGLASKSLSVCNESRERVIRKSYERDKKE